MAAPPKCDVCGTAHHEHQAHRFVSDVASRGIFTNFVVSVDPTIKPDPRKRLVAILVDRKCVVCGAKFESKRAHASTCSPKCRQRKRRAKP